LSNNVLYYVILFRGPFRNALSRSVFQSFTGLHRTLTTTPSNTFGMPDLTNAFVAEWKQVPAAMFQHLVESIPRRVEGVIAAKVGPTPH
jgi:hypothetical protein